MKALMFILLTLQSAFAGASDDLILEYATGIASEHLPLTLKWSGPVTGDGSYYKEHAVRASYDINKHVAVTLMSGRIAKWNFRDRDIGYSPPPEGNPQPSYRQDQQVFYFVPGIRLTAYVFTFNLGGILYDSDTENRAYLKYPFNGSHRFKPSFTAALGDEDVYLFVSFFNSLPLYSGGGGMEAGLYGRVGGYYEQKGYIGSSEYGLGIGYRGEFKMTRNAALALGLSLGHSDDARNNVYTVMAGLKVRIPLKD